METNFIEVLEFISKNIETLSSNLVPLWHPLGFVSCVIKEVPSDCTIRLHYWPKGERRVKNPHWPIHTHSYKLNSLVLIGEVRDLQYGVISGTGQSVYSVNYPKGGSELVKTADSVQIHTEIDEIKFSGEQYQVPRDKFHQTEVPIFKSAVTLVILTDHSSDAPKVLGSDISEKYFYDRIPFDSTLGLNEVRKALNCYLAKEVNRSY